MDYNDDRSNSRQKIEAWARAIFFDIVALVGLWVPKAAWGINSWLFDLFGMILIWYMTKRIILSGYR